MKNNCINERIDDLEEKLLLLDSLKYYEHNYYLIKNNDLEIKTYIIIKKIFKLHEDTLEANIIRLGHKDKYNAYSAYFEPMYAHININSMRKISKKQFQDFVNKFKNNLDELINPKSAILELNEIINKCKNEI